MGQKYVFNINYYLVNSRFKCKVSLKFKNVFYRPDFLHHPSKAYIMVL